MGNILNLKVNDYRSEIIYHGQQQNMNSNFLKSVPQHLTKYSHVASEQDRGSHAIHLLVSAVTYPCYDWHEKLDT